MGILRQTIQFLIDLPLFFRYLVIRLKIRVNYDLPPSLTIKLAETRSELEGAFRVLHNSYTRMGYIQPSPSGLRVTLHHALPTTSVIVAKLGSRVVGTVTLVRDNKLKLPMEKDWNLSFLHSKASRVTEVTCLAIDQEVTGTLDVFFPLLKFVYQYSTILFGSDYLSIAVSPKEADFYRGVLFFEPLDHKVVNEYIGAPAIALYLDLKKAHQNFRLWYSKMGVSKNLYRYFVHEVFPNLQFPSREGFTVNDPVMSTELLNYFFIEKSAIGRSITEDELEQIIKHYPDKLETRACRLEVDIPVTVLVPKTGRSTKGQLRDVSRTGARLVGENLSVIYGFEELKIAALFPIPGNEFCVNAHLIWYIDAHGAGLEVPPGQIQWDLLITSLEDKLLDADSLRKSLQKSLEAA